ncbi:peptidoglycan D,D-transpeptidase FtsI family protein [Corynebacterium cystitidis]|uniref:Cell division protein FtsI (Penicillin-binding protein 3) n=1 Tax=Corynebacterium cystitidis DSM 20524 TaxID=1121357 RepID=A0A1H9NPL3_9CORY|nr:penicillin-binding protein 2 [Corynebacterium cystitidis]WJY82784.1 Penicillin-binding protein PbpB [Corynebacterium cystitidis DSM 20524]SER37831.1 cell division protein FtsI (penicillin-binding protein 3) [Corynebacterium cystitidis DSM 20524]SNV70564.1 penicillin-binding protein [Corynebacterium cystitidis]
MTDQKATTHKRLGIVLLAFTVAAALLVGRLAWVQVVWGPELSAAAEEQRARIYVDPARRGEIKDREGNQLAYTMQARSLTVSPIRLRDEITQQERAALEEEGLDAAMIEAQLPAKTEDRLRTMANEIPKLIDAAGQSTSDNAEDVDPKEILDKLKADNHYEVLVRNVDPDLADEIAATFHGVAADHQDIRQYPNGAIAENIIGKVSMDGQGQFGLEASGDALLTGNNGRRTEDVSTDGQAIPGTLRDEVPSIDGSDVTLTIDLDLQTYVQQLLEQAKTNSGAKSAEAVVLDVATGDVLAMANTDTIDPNGDLEKQLSQGRDFENQAISHPYEPGSVAKIIPAAAALEEGVTTPDEVHQVPGSINMAGVTVADAWDHGVVPYTTAGIFGKSSNVGTLMIAERLGEERFADYLTRFGVGQTTGIELPNESAGLYPPLEQWSGGTFANLPIGQGMSWTTLQMASIYQTLANGGERIEPRIIESVTDAEGKPVEQPEPARTQVVSPETAKTTVDMFQSVFQEDPTGLNSGTAQGQGIEGYQLAGKTGTAQKVDPDTGAYSQNKFWITFAGIAPADDPRFVVAVMLDEPQRGPMEGGAGGQSAAPVFREIANWLINRDNIPPNPPADDPIILQAQ